MKITKSESPKDFKPYTINIEVHTQEDENVMVALGKSNISLPRQLESYKVESKATYAFCEQLNDVYKNN